jgi:hypothetical protein
MSTAELMKEDPLAVRVREIYSNLQRLYRLGSLEAQFECYQYEWPELNNLSDFYDCHSPGSGVAVTSTTIKYNDAVENLYQLVLFLENEMNEWVKEHSVLILQIRNLV